MERDIIEVLNDIEGYNIDNGVSWGGTTIIYFPKKELYEKCKKFDCIKNHSIMIESINKDVIDGRTVLIIDDSMKFIEALKEIRKYYVYSAYVYIEHLEDNETNRQILKDNDDIIDEIFTNDMVENKKVTTI